MTTVELKQTHTFEKSFFKVFSIEDLRYYIFSFQSGIPFKDFKNCKKACECGHLPILKKLWEEHISIPEPKHWPSQELYLIACQKGHIDIVKWLDENGIYALKDWQMKHQWEMAVANDYQELAKYLYYRYLKDVLDYDKFDTVIYYAKVYNPQMLDWIKSIRKDHKKIRQRARSRKRGGKKSKSIYLQGKKTKEKFYRSLL